MSTRAKNNRKRREVPVEEIVEKPLSNNIIDDMANADEERKDLVMVLSNVSEMQANLISRMFKTLKVEYTVVSIEQLEAALDTEIAEEETDGQD